LFNQIHLISATDTSKVYGPQLMVFKIRSRKKAVTVIIQMKPSKK